MGGLPVIGQWLGERQLRGLRVQVPRLRFSMPSQTLFEPPPRPHSSSVLPTSSGGRIETEDFGDIVPGQRGTLFLPDLLGRLAAMQLLETRGRDKTIRAAHHNRAYPRFLLPFPNA